MSIKKPHQKAKVSPSFIEYAGKFIPEKLEGDEATTRIFREIREIIQGFLKEEKIVQASAQHGDLIVVNLVPPDAKPEILWTDELQTKVKARWSAESRELDSPSYIPRDIRSIALKILLTHTIIDHQGEPMEHEIRTSEIILEKDDIRIGNELVPMADNNETHLQGVFYAVLTAIRQAIEERVLESTEQ